MTALLPDLAALRHHSVFHTAINVMFQDANLITTVSSLQPLAAPHSPQGKPRVYEAFLVCPLLTAPASTLTYLPSAQPPLLGPLFLLPELCTHCPLC